MIYQPYLVYDLRVMLGQAVIKAAFLALEDYIRGQNKPWAYYLGAATGYAAVATGIPNAAATLYAVGNAVRLLIEHSSDGSLAEIYVNGILAAQVDTWIDNSIGEWRHTVINLVDGVLNRVDIINKVNNNTNKTSNVNWLALGYVDEYQSQVLLRSSNVITLAIRIRDAEQNSPLATLPIYLPNGLTVPQVQDYANVLLPEVDALTAGAIASASATFALDLPSGLKASPMANHTNERGGLITFSTTGPRAASVRIPAMRFTLMPGNTFSLSAPEVAAFVTRLTTQTTTHNIRPVTEHNHQYVSARAGRKSFRK